MSARLRRLLLGAGVLAVGAPAALVVACADSSASDPGLDGAEAGTGPSDAAKADRASSAADTGAPRSLCELTRAFYEGCGNASDLNCGAGFDTWCADNDKAVNSDAYRQAELDCLTSANCDPTSRRGCEYGHYEQTTPTAAQSALVTAYCATCEPEDPTGCKTRSTHYDTSKGPAGVSDIFIAAWELADPVVEEITTKCTGGNASVDAGTCAKAFSSCSADVYLAHLPDCPK